MALPLPLFTGAYAMSESRAFIINRSSIIAQIVINKFCSSKYYLSWCIWKRPIHATSREPYEIPWPWAPNLRLLLGKKKKKCSGKQKTYETSVDRSARIFLIGCIGRLLHTGFIKVYITASLIGWLMNFCLFFSFPHGLLY